jgi:ABC-type oligopeptide transport system ATPase subunit
MDSMQLINEVKNWKLEAKLEDTNRYFYHLDMVKDILEGKISYIIGRKGTGKTAISEFLINYNDPCVFSNKLSFKNFPFQELYSLKDSNYINPNEYITLWKYVIYTSVVKSFIKNENIDMILRNKLEKIYFDDIKNSLPRTIKRWTGGELNLSVLGGIGLSHEEVNNTTVWINRVELLEDVIRKYIDDSKYIIVFDELDEDYRDMLSEEKFEKYTALLTSLFKSVQDIKSIFPNSECKIFPIICLRDDIYDLLKDPDKTKWSDLKRDIEWEESTMKKLLAFRLSRALYPDGKIYQFDEIWFKLFSKKDVVYGNFRRKMMSAFSYITRSTLLRPRDYIRYISDCCDLAYKNNDSIIMPEIVRNADKKFSNYLKSELVDEIHGAIPDIDILFELFSRIRKQTLSIEEYINEYDKALEEGDIKNTNISIKNILNVLFYFSIIGNQPSQKSHPIFRYKTPDARLNFKEKIVVHRGLFKSLQIL